MLVVTMTSWTKRIDNCVLVINSILSNTILPDKIFLNLSIEEFPNKEKDLPINLIDLISRLSLITLNWVDGPNTKTMKKVFPILKYLEDDDIIIDMDDDLIMPSKLIESRLNDFNKYNGKCAISGCSMPKLSMLRRYRKIKHPTYALSAISVFTKKMLSGYELYYSSDECIKTYHDDALYVFILSENNIEIKLCSDYSTWGNSTKNKIKAKSNNGSMAAGHGYYTDEKACDVFIKIRDLKICLLLQ